LPDIMMAAPLLFATHLLCTHTVHVRSIPVILERGRCGLLAL
jgi:hypothetical protein